MDLPWQSRPDGEAGRGEAGRHQRPSSGCRARSLDLPDQGIPLDKGARRGASDVMLPHITKNPARSGARV